MVDIDEVIATAIRTAWLQVNGPASQSHHQIEVETARRIREAREREGIILIERMDLRTASRNAALAFSTRMPAVGDMDSMGQQAAIPLDGYHTQHEAHFH
jgi:hypothetical protein